MILRSHIGAGFPLLSFPLYEDLYDPWRRGRSFQDILVLSFLRELFSLYITRLLFEGSELS